jgi:hypothetical protein
MIWAEKWRLIVWQCGNCSEVCSEIYPLNHIAYYLKKGHPIAAQCVCGSQTWKPIVKGCPEGCGGIWHEETANVVNQVL